MTEHTTTAILDDPPAKAEPMPLLLDFGDAAARLSIGRTLFYMMIGDGRCPLSIIRFGRRSMVRRAELEAWVEAGCPPRARWMEGAR